MIRALALYFPCLSSRLRCIPIVGAPGAIWGLVRRTLDQTVRAQALAEILVT